jgi:GrpB-like predicted nucleotidyltransferase (UPF0157 family)
MNQPLGLESGIVRVVPYDPRWPDLFQAELQRLRTALLPLVATIEHIGSTAVPGLAAKPVLDILAGYDDPELLQQYIMRFEAAGYEHRGEQGIPGREFFRRGNPRSYHVHLTRLGNTIWRQHLGFRDLLRSDPALRDAYADLKRQLAAQFPTNREAYIEGKAGFIQTALKRCPIPPDALDKRI